MIRVTFPHDVLARNFGSAGIELTDELFLAVVDYVEYNGNIALAYTAILEVLSRQGIDVKGWRCANFLKSPQLIGLITPQHQIALCYMRGDG